ncbi:LuxR C-terminal-related transcriptional regulator [Amycolatopsis sp. NPDC023774]|uniref:helix-turn-helix transcriptional regulator n=1 Tax=Amycolatopsis sp. NPDC023774 TaxID=3155015 RepID=UPI0033C9F2B5
MSERLEAAFAARVTELPAPARTLLRVAAAAEDGTLGTILEGAEIIDGAPRTVADLVAAVRARLIVIEDQQVRFLHPLMRSAIYQAATVAERQAAHAALVEVYAEDPDRRVWHRLAAATGPDPAVCAEAEKAARRALRRGAAATAAVVFERAATATPDPARRGRLLLEAAAAASDQGHGETVMRLLAEASLLDLGSHEHALWMWLEEGFRSGRVGDAGRVSELTRTATRMAALGDRDLALNLLVSAASRCYWGDLRAEGLAVVRAADAIGAPAGDQRMLYVQVFAAPIERGAVVLRELDRSGGPDDAAGLYLRGMAVCLAGAFDKALPLLAASAERLRGQGRLRLLAQVLSIQAWAALEVGDFAVAMPAAQESQRLAAEVRRPLWETGGRIAEATAAALRGDQRAVETLTAEASRVALPIGAAALLSLVQYTRGALELARGRCLDAYEQLLRIYQPGDAASHHLTACHVIGDFAEAAVGSGHREQAVALVRQVEPGARLSPGAWLHIQLAYARLQLAADDEAEPLFEEALRQTGAAWPLWRARVELAHGKWLRRRRRHLESRAPLRSARDTFDALGATPWAEQAHQELRAAGESSPRRRLDGFEELTPQELQVAQMVAQGLTNRAIAQRLYLSHRTIESHLYRMFPKLGVRSRVELVTVMQGRLDPVG